MLSLSMSNRASSSGIMDIMEKLSGQLSQNTSPGTLSSYSASLAALHLENHYSHLHITIPVCHNCHNAISAIDFNHSTVLYILHSTFKWNIINVELKYSIFFKKRVTL